MSRRLTEEDKVQLLKHLAPTEILNATKHIVDSTETKDFHEGFASGILVVFEFLQNTKDERVIGEIVRALIQESIKYTK